MARLTLNGHSSVTDASTDLIRVPFDAEFNCTHSIDDRLRVCDAPFSSYALPNVGTLHSDDQRRVQPATWRMEREAYALASSCRLTLLRPVFCVLSASIAGRGSVRRPPVVVRPTFIVLAAG